MTSISHIYLCPPPPHTNSKPIDLLGQYIGAEDEEDISLEMQEPYNVLRVSSQVQI